MSQSGLTELLSQQPTGHCLLQGFYQESEVFEAETQGIFLKSWLYVGHCNRIPKIGDYFLSDLAGESVVVLKNADDQYTALLNVCQHRGSRVCIEPEGHVSRLVCPYHAWTYGLDGQLLRAKNAGADFDCS